MSRSTSKFVFMVNDLLLINVSFFICLLLRFDGQIPLRWMSIYRMTFWAYSVICLLTFSFWKFYDHDWRYMTAKNLMRIFLGVMSGLFLYVVFLFFIKQWTFPRTVIFMALIFTTVFIGGSRLVVYTIFSYGKNITGTNRELSKNVLIIGAGDSGEMLVRDMARRGNIPYNPVGFVDDDPQKRGMIIRDIPVLGEISEVGEIAAKRKVEMIIISIPSATPHEMKRIVAICKGTGIEVKTVPSLFSILDGSVNISQIRDVEPEDILGREVVLEELKEIKKCLGGKSVLITGAGGSIGSELSRQTIKYGPKKLVLLDSSEYGVYSIYTELVEKRGKDLLIPIVANVQHGKEMDRIFRNLQFDIILHAAAYKHVPLMEENVEAAVKNNIWGTRNLATLAEKYGADKFVLVSSDKAVNPANVMGATKRIAEMVIQSLSNSGKTKFSAVRFGNVLGSNGSVLPLFKRQIAGGGPVTVTHPEIIRYFMTVSEAVHLVLAAAAMSRGGEIFILDMGEPVRILDMARSLIRLSGFEPDRDIKIEFIGLRPGEKLYEELNGKEEKVQKTKNEKIFVTSSLGFDREKLFQATEELWQLANNTDLKGVFTKLCEIVPEYNGRNATF
ncbi:MAG: polysaccharide biosynthesis protein [bacterium]